MKRVAAFWAMAICTSILLQPSPGAAATALQLTTVEAFDGLEGALPLGGNLLYLSQNIYGATYAGSGPQGSTDLGLVFSVPDVVGQSTPTILHVFTGPDGAHPNGGLVADAQGNLYGTTKAGGAYGFGTVFKLTNPHAANGAWALTTLHNFAGIPDGASPTAGVTFGPGGSIYGATPDGGLGYHPLSNQILCPTTGCGTLFKIASTGAYQTIFTFNGATSGVNPATNLVVDPTGNVIGALRVGLGGSLYHDFGYLFVLSPAGTLKPVAAFEGYAGGTIVRDGAGNVYGAYNKTYSNPQGSDPRGAAVWKVSAGTHLLSHLAVLTADETAGGVARDAAGNLYATTTGVPFGTGPRLNGGSVFAVSPSGTVTTLATLGFNNEGPLAGVIMDPAGNLWGTTSAGGSACPTTSNLTPTGCGTLFVLSH